MNHCCRLNEGVLCVRILILYHHHKSCCDLEPPEHDGRVADTFRFACSWGLEGRGSGSFTRSDELSGVEESWMCALDVCVSEGLSVCCERGSPVWILRHLCVSGSCHFATQSQMKIW